MSISNDFDNFIIAGGLTVSEAAPAVESSALAVDNFMASLSQKHLSLENDEPAFIFDETIPPPASTSEDIFFAPLNNNLSCTDSNMTSYMPPTAPSSVLPRRGSRRVSPGDSLDDLNSGLPLREWEAAHEADLEKKVEAEAALKNSRQQKARADLEEFYKTRAAKIEKAKNENRRKEQVESEKRQSQHQGQLANNSPESWARVWDLIFSPATTATDSMKQMKFTDTKHSTKLSGPASSKAVTSVARKDTARMKQVLDSLRSSAGVMEYCSTSSSAPFVNGTSH